jgi:dienelactone hydrolase
MGYVTASINYRLGFPIQLELEQPMSEAVLRGVHDMKAAIRWFRKNVAESGNTYSIDPEQIYIGGVSAGGFIALQLAYVDEMDELPSTIDFDNPGLGGEMEGLSGNDGYPSHVNAIINIAGAVSDTTHIHPGDEPACLFHGTGDTTVPFGSEILVIAGTFPVTEVDGSESVAEKLTEAGIEHCFEIYEGQGHVPHDGNQFYYDTTLSVISNFLSHFVCNIDLDCDYREILVGTEEMVELETAVFPNPASEIIRLSNLSDSFSRIEYRILDMQGQLAAAGNTVGGEIDVSHLAPGIYMLRWSDGKKNFSATVSIIR